jgi:hypothetical protein
MSNPETSNLKIKQLPVDYASTETAVETRSCGGSCKNCSKSKQGVSQTARGSR